MEKTVTFRDNQEFRADDPNSLQTFVQDSMQHVVNDAVSSSTHYSGLTVTKAGTTTVQVVTGRLYAGGKVYAHDTAETLDLFSSLPTSASKIVAIVAWGSTAESDTESRDFLTDVTTGATEPKAVTMEVDRVCNIGTVVGTESSSPQVPTITSTYLLIALVTMTTSGVSAVEMCTANALPVLNNLSTRTAALETWKGQTDPKVSTITSDIAKLSTSLSEKASLALLRQVAADVAALKDLSKLPDDYAQYGCDHFLYTAETNASGSDSSGSSYSARIEEGIRFPFATSATSVLALLNSIDSTVAVTNNLCLPAWTGKTRMDNTDGYAGYDYLSSFQFQTTTTVQKTVSRTRVRYGATYTVCTNAGYLNGRDITYNEATHSFTKDGETFVLADGYDATDISTDHTWIRITEVFSDSYEETYWDLETTTKTVTGSQLSQVFLNAQDGWLTEIGLHLHDVGSSGTVTVMLCEADDGKPELSAVLATTTVAVADLKTYSTRTAVSITPTFLSSGSRYAIVVQSGGQHSLCTVSGATIPQGTYFHYVDGAFQAVDTARSIMFDLRFAYFGGLSYLAVQLASLSLSGGIAAIDILTKMVCPSSCSMTFEVQINGTWYPLSTDSAGLGLLDGLPNLIPLRAVFVGTPDVMPGFGLVGSQVKVATCASKFTHYSTVRNLSAATTTVRVIALVEDFDATYHALGCKLIVGTTLVSPAVTATRGTDSGTEYTFSFTITSSTSYVIRLNGSTTNTAKLFHVAERTDIAF
jgi:hypothetical protein